jgi:hypothetical protein
MAWWGNVLIGAGSFALGAVAGCFVCCKIIFGLCGKGPKE